MHFSQPVVAFHDQKQTHFIRIFMIFSYSNRSQAMNYITLANTVQKFCSIFTLSLSLFSLSLYLKLDHFIEITKIDFTNQTVQLTKSELIYSNMFPPISINYIISLKWRKLITLMNQCSLQKVKKYIQIFVQDSLLGYAGPKLET